MRIQHYFQVRKHIRNQFSFGLSAPAIVVPGGDGASHRVPQNDMPPLAGLLLSAIAFTPLFRSSLTAVSCFNTSFLSDNPEKPGELFFPLSVVDAPQTESADIEIALLHHPYNWLEPNNAHELRTWVDRHSDLVLTGHEHQWDIYTKTRAGKSVEYLEGQALFDKSVDQNGFNVVLLDIAAKEWKSFTFCWTDQAYLHQEGQDTTRPFARTRDLLQSGFANNPMYMAELADVGTGFTHSQKLLQLPDVYVFPSLTNRVIQQKLKLDPDLPRKLREADMVSFLKSQKRLLIFGADLSGKTSLARSLYRLIQAETNNIPVLINGKDIKDQQWHSDLIDIAFSDQYDRAKFQRFNQLPADRRALILDDFDAASLNRRKLAETIETVCKRFGMVLIFADEYLDIDQVINAGKRPILQDFPQYQIDEFGRVLRSKLISKWVALGRADQEDTSLHRQIEQKERTIDTLLGKQLLPSYPIIILAILQAMETAKNLNTASGSYGELYEALITDRLVSVSKKPTDLGTKYTVISRIAYHLFRSESDTLSREDISSVLAEYFNEYGIRLELSNFVDELLSAGILRTCDGNVGFKYPYYYHFFVARYFRDNMRDPKEGTDLQHQIEHMADRVYFEPYANVLIFYLYLTKDTTVIERIRRNAANIYASISPATLESDAEGINKLYSDPLPPLTLPNTTVEENREAVRAALDEIDQARQTPALGEKLTYSEELDELIKLNIALKTLYILGQVLRNFPGSLKGDVKKHIAEECYLLGLRVLGYMFNAVRDNVDDLRLYFARLMAERQPFVASSALIATADQAVRSILELWGVAMIKTISHAVGMQELDETYRQVLLQHSEKLSVQLIDATIKLDHFDTFPSAQVDKLHKRVENNPIAFCILRQVIANHLYLFRVSHETRQKYTQRFGLQPSTGRLVEGGLAKD